MLRSLTLITLLLWAGCSFLGEDGSVRDRRVIDVPATDVEALGVSEDNIVAFDFEGALPVPCYEFEEAIVDRDGRVVDVRVRARSTSTSCVTVTGTLHVSPLNIAVLEEGAYTFRFWRGKEAPLTVEVNVP